MLFRQPSNATISLAQTLPELKSHSKKTSVDSMKSSKSPLISSVNPTIQKTWEVCQKMVAALMTYLSDESLYVTKFKMDRMKLKREASVAYFVLYDLKDYQTQIQDLCTLPSPSAKHEEEALKAMEKIKNLYLDWQNHIKELRAFDFALYTWLNDTTDSATFKKLTQLIKTINKWQANSEREKQLKAWTQVSISQSLEKHSKSHKSMKSSPENSIAVRALEEKSGEKPLTLTEQLISQLYTWIDNPDNTFELAKLKKLIRESLTAPKEFEDKCRFKKSTFDFTEKLQLLMTDAVKECEAALVNMKNMSSSLPKLR